MARPGKRECGGPGSGARCMMTGIAMAVLLSLLGGCAKFTATRKMDPGPFGENVTILMGDIAADVSSRQAFHIKPYLYGPNLEDYQAEWANMRKTMRGIVLYSTQVVNIAQSAMSERNKAKELARTLREVTANAADQRFAEIGMTRESLAALIKEVESQQNMFDALDKAQPLVDAISTYVDRSFEQVELALTKVVADINMRMDARWGLTRSNVEALLALQGRTIKSYALLYQYREGDAAGLDALLENDPALHSALGKDRQVSDKELEAAEAQIMARLKNLFSLRDHVLPQVDQYLAEARERDDLYRQHRDTGKKLRTTMMLWARSHRNLARGIPVPPEIDLYNVLIGSAKKLL